MSELIFLESSLKMPLMTLPVRSTVVRLGGANLLISPGSRLEKEKLINLAGITDIVAPNFFHCSGIKRTALLHPIAKIWGPENCFAKKLNIKWTNQLSKNLWPFQEELPMVLIQGMPKINETVFVHKKSKTLIVADLAFNLLDAKGLGARIILNLFGTYKKFGVSKFFLKYVEDKNVAQQSLGELFSYDFENIAISHGSNVLGGAKDLLLKALSERGLEPK